MIKGDRWLTPDIAYTNTKANIIAYDLPIEGMRAFATDTDEIGTYTGAAWEWMDATSHDPVTLGSPSNGLGLAGQELTLAAATASTPGAATAAQITKLDGIEAGAQVNLSFSTIVSFNDEAVFFNDDIVVL